MARRGSPLSPSLIRTPHLASVSGETRAEHVRKNRAVQEPHGAVGEQDVESAVVMAAQSEEREGRVEAKVVGLRSRDSLAQTRRRGGYSRGRR